MMNYFAMGGVWVGQSTSPAWNYFKKITTYTIKITLLGYHAQYRRITMQYDERV